MNRDNLVKRLLFVAWAAPLGWIIINSPGFSIPKETAASLLIDPMVTVFPGQILAIILTILGTSEYLRMLKVIFPKNGFWLIYIYIGIQLGSYFAPMLSLSARYDTFILFFLVAVESFIWGRQSGRWRRASLLFSGAVFMSMSGYACLSFYSPSFQQLFGSRFSTWLLSQMGIITVVASIFLCDSAAFFIGSFFGRHHFSNVSPKKTIEGSIAGFVASIITSASGWFFLTSAAAHSRFSFFPGDSVSFGIIMGIIIGIFAQVGDLVVSLMKRYFRVKDASSLIPGHGGILDRFDSVFFTAPVIQLFMLLAIRFVK